MRSSDLPTTNNNEANGILAISSFVAKLLRWFMQKQTTLRDYSTEGFFTEEFFTEEYFTEEFFTEEFFTEEYFVAK